MKRLACLVLLLWMLGGCAAGAGNMEKAIDLRSRVQSAAQCSFDAEILADYGDMTYTFTLACVADGQGNVNFTVTAPETISGITGSLSSQGGKLTFGDVALSFPMLAEKLITPVGGPWVFYTALRGGNIKAVGNDGAYTRMTVNDSYADDALTLDIYLDNSNLPVQADVIWENRRILTMQIRNFQIG